MKVNIPYMDGMGDGGWKWFLRAAELHNPTSGFSSVCHPKVTIVGKRKDSRQTPE